MPMAGLAARFPPVVKVVLQKISLERNERDGPTPRSV